MKPNLYICHTAYQVLVDLLRAGRCACENGPHTMVLSASVPDTAAPVSYTHLTLPTIYSV